MRRSARRHSEADWPRRAVYRLDRGERRCGQHSRSLAAVRPLRSAASMTTQRLAAACGDCAAAVAGRTRRSQPRQALMLGAPARRRRRPRAASRRSGLTCVLPDTRRSGRRRRSSRLDERRRCRAGDVQHASRAAVYVSGSHVCSSAAASQRRCSGRRAGGGDDAVHCRVRPAQGPDVATEVALITSARVRLARAHGTCASATGCATVAPTVGAPDRTGRLRRGRERRQRAWPIAATMPDARVATSTSALAGTGMPTSNARRRRAQRPAGAAAASAASRTHGSSGSRRTRGVPNG